MPRRHISDAQRRARLAVRHRLTPSTRTEDIVSVTDDVLALHASDPATVFLSAAARMPAATIEGIEAALYVDRRLVRHHAMRRTLWVMSPTVCRLAHTSTSVKIAAKERRRLEKMLAGTGGIADPSRWVADAIDALVAAVAERGEVGTRPLGEALPHLAVRIPTAVGRKYQTTLVAHTRALMVAAMEGRVVRGRPLGGWTGTHYVWSVPAPAWDPAAAPEPARTASAALLELWLRRFGPGTETDLRWWTGWTAAQTRKALADLDAEAVDLDSGETGFVLPDDPDDPSPEPWAAALPSLDPTPMGWKQRDWYLDGAHVPRVFDRNGNVGPTLWVDGRIVGGWVQRPDGALRTEILEPLEADARARLDEALRRVSEFLGESRFRVRFPSPNQRDLLG